MFASKTEMLTICFTPQKDITPYELAMIILKSQGIVSLSRCPIEKTVWENLELDIKRHFAIALV